MLTPLRIPPITPPRSRVSIVLRKAPTCHAFKSHQLQTAAQQNGARNFLAWRGEVPNGNARARALARLHYDMRDRIAPLSNASHTMREETKRKHGVAGLHGPPGRRSSLVRVYRGYDVERGLQMMLWRGLLVCGHDVALDHREHPGAVGELQVVRVHH